MRVRYLLSEMATGLWRNVTMTTAMIITFAVSLASFGAGLLLYHGADDLRRYYHDGVEVAIFLRTDATAAQRRELHDALLADPLVRRVAYESPQQAYENFRRMFRDSAPDLVRTARPETFWGSYRVKLRDPERSRQLVQRYRQRPGVDDVVDQQRYLAKLFGMLGGAQRLALVLATAQGAAALLLVACTVRVAAYGRRREIAVMRLVGAPNWLVRVPFVLEAVLASLIGTVLAVAGLLVGEALFVDGALRPLTDVLPTMVTWRDIVRQVPLLAAAGTAASAATGWLTLRWRARV